MFVVVTLLCLLAIIQGGLGERACLLDRKKMSKVCGELVKSIQGCMGTGTSDDDEGSASRVDCAQRKAEDIHSLATGGGMTSGGSVWVMCKEYGFLEEVVQLSNEGNLKKSKRKQCKGDEVLVDGKCVFQQQCMGDEVLVDGECVFLDCDLGEVLGDDGTCVTPCKDDEIRVDGICVKKTTGRQGKVGPLTKTAIKTKKTLALFKKISEGSFELIDIAILPVGPTTKFLDKLKGASEIWIKGI